jgi:hypothetical protein
MWKQSDQNGADVVERHSRHFELRSRDLPTATTEACCPRCGSSMVRPTIASIRGCYFKCGRCDQVWHCFSEVPKAVEQTSECNSIRAVLEYPPVLIRDREYELRLIDVTQQVDGGATVNIAVVGTPQTIQLNVSGKLLQDPIALRLRAAYFLRQMMSGKMSTRTARETAVS